jgi:hypothetical protein
MRYGTVVAVASVFMRLLVDEAGQDMIEYALVAALISLGRWRPLKGLRR